MADNEITIRTDFGYKLLRVIGGLIWAIGFIMIVIGMLMILGVAISPSVTTLIGLAGSPLFLALGCLLIITGSLSIIAGNSK